MTTAEVTQVAKIFRGNRPSKGVELARFQWETCVEDFEDWMADLNPAFDRDAFLRMCGYTR